MAALVAGGLAEQQQQRIAVEVCAQPRAPYHRRIGGDVGAGIALLPGVEHGARAVYLDQAQEAGEARHGTRGPEPMATAAA